MDATPPVNPYSPPLVAANELASPETTATQAAIDLPQPHLGWVVLIVVGFLFFQMFVGVAIAAVSVALFVAQSDLPQDEMMRELPAVVGLASTQTVMIFAASASTCLFAFGLCWAVHRQAARRRMAMRWPTAGQALLVVLLFLPLAIVVSEVNNWLVPYIPSFGGGALEEAMRSMSQMPFPLLVVAVCVFPAVGEELLFRGFIGRGLVGRYGPLIGVTLTSILFGAVHIHPLQAISAAILGVVLHLLYLWTKSLIAPMLLHFLNNLFAMVCMRYSETLPIPGVSVMEQDGEMIYTPPALVAASLGISVLLLLLLWQSRSRWQGEDGRAWKFGYVTAETPADVTARRLSPLPNLALLATAFISYGGLIWFLYATIQQWAA